MFGGFIQLHCLTRYRITDINISTRGFTVSQHILVLELYPKHHSGLDGSVSITVSVVKNVLNNPGLKAATVFTQDAIPLQLM